MNWSLNKVKIQGLFRLSWRVLAFSLLPGLSAHAQAVRGVSGDLWADKVLGQADYGIPNSAFGEDKFNEATAKNLSNPSSTFVDTVRDILYVVDTANNRILVTHHASQAVAGQGADLVLGQPDFFHASADGDSNLQHSQWWLPAPPFPVNVPTASNLHLLLNYFYSPEESDEGANMAADGNGNLYVPDTYNNRVLRYDYADMVSGHEPIAASQAWGQPDFGGYYPNNIGGNASGGPTADNLSLFALGDPVPDRSEGVATDAWGDLWVADFANSRVLRYPSPQGACCALPNTTADVVLGQPDFTHNTGGGASNQVGACTGVRVDAAGNVYVADSANNRLLIFQPSGADSYGRPVYPANPNASAAIATNQPQGLEFDPTNTNASAVALWVSSLGGVTEFKVNLADFSSTQINQITTDGQNFGTMGVDANGKVYVSSKTGQQVGRYDPATQNSVGIFNPSYFAGPPIPNNVGNIGMWHPGAVCIAKSVGANPVTQIIVADTLRLHFWDMPSNGPQGLSNGQPEDGYAGSTNFLVRNPNGGFQQTCADQANHLYADQGGGGIAVFSLPLPSANPEATPVATVNPTLKVLGTTRTTQWGYVLGLAVDPDNNLWVTDSIPDRTSHNRVLHIRDPLGQSNSCNGAPGPCVDIILGQANDTSYGCNGGGSYPIGAKCSQNPNAGTLSNPSVLKMDHAGDLFVSDFTGEVWGNWRLLRWNAAKLQSLYSTTTCVFGLNADGSPAIPADGVYGTNGSFTENQQNPADNPLEGDAFAEPAFNHDDSVMVMSSIAALAGNSPLYPPVIIDNPRGLDSKGNPLPAPNAGDNYAGHLNDYTPLGGGGTFDDQDNLYVTESNRNFVRIYYQPFSGAVATATSTPTSAPVSTGTSTPISTSTWTPTPTSTPTPPNTPTPTPTAATCPLSAQWPVEEPYGVAVDGARGRVYVADQSVSLVDVFGADGTPASPLGSGVITFPVGVAVDGNGNVYVTDEIQNTYTNGQAQYRVDRFDNTGLFLGSFPTFAATEGSQYIEAPVGIAVNSAGTTIYVADQYNGTVQAFSPSGTLLSQWGQGGGNGGPGLVYPVGLAVDPSGNVYVTDWDTDLVQVFDFQGHFLRQWGVDDQTPLAGAAFIALYQNCVVYVTDGFGTVGFFDLNGNVLGYAQQLGDTQILGAEGIAVDGSQNVYLADDVNGSVFKMGACLSVPCAPLPTSTPTPDPTNTLTPNGLTNTPTNTLTLTPTNAATSTAIPTATLGAFCCQVAWTQTPSTLGGARGIAMDNVRNVGYVADGNTIREFDPGTGNLIGTVGAVGAWGSPQGINLGSDGNLYVANYSLGTLQKVDPTTGTVLATLGQGDGLGNVRDVWVDTNGDLYVSSLNNTNNLYRYVFTAPNSYAKVTLSLGTSLNTPTGVARVGSVLFVADSVNNRVVKLKESVTGSNNYDQVTVLTGNSIALNVPQELTADAAGNIYVADYSNGALVVWGPDGSFKYNCQNPVYGNPFGIGVDASGNLYLGDAGSNRVVKVAGCLAVATPTATNTPTDSMTPTASLTATPSATASGTPTTSSTSTGTPSGTPTGTATSTTTATPSFTSTATSSSTNTVTTTSSSTATPDPTDTPTNSLTHTPTSTDSTTATPSSSPTLTASATATNSATTDPTDTPTNSPTNAVTCCFTSTATDSTTATPTSSPTLTATSTATPDPTDTATNTLTLTPTNTSTVTPSSTPTGTATSTATSTPSMTATPDPTDTPSSTATASSTASPDPTDTPTSTYTSTATCTYTNSPTPTPTSTSSFTATPDPTDTASFTPTTTATLTFTNTSTNTPTATPSDSMTPTATSTSSPSPSSTPTASFTASWTASLTATLSATSTATNTPTNTPTATPTNTPTATHTATATNSFTKTFTGTPTNTCTTTPTNTRTNTPMSTRTNTPAMTQTNTLTATPSSTPTGTATSTTTKTTTATTTATSTRTSAPTSTPTPGSGSGCGTSLVNLKLMEFASCQSSQASQNFEVINTGTSALNLNQIMVKFWVDDTNFNSNAANTVTGLVNYGGGFGPTNMAVNGAAISALRFSPACGPDSTHQANWELTVSDTDTRTLSAGTTWSNIQTAIHVGSGFVNFSPGSADWYSPCGVGGGSTYTNDLHFAVYYQGDLVLASGGAAPSCRTQPTCTPGGKAPIFLPAVDSIEGMATPTVSPTPSVDRNGSVVAAPNVSSNGQPIQFRVNLDQPAQVHLALFDLVGEKVFEETHLGEAGWNSLNWNLANQSGSPVASGLYIYEVEVEGSGRPGEGGFSTYTGKVVVLH